jgi:hypothetical protein
MDRDDPRCLYCGFFVDIELKGEWIARSSIRYDVEVLTCRKCKEVFEIHSMQGYDGETEISGFVFTCKELCVQYSYNHPYFRVGEHNLLYQSLDQQASAKGGTEVLAFPVEFSDKEKLWEKLRTYLIFS